MTHVQAGHIDHCAWSPDEKAHYLKYIPSGVKSVLDVGCGMGEFISLLSQMRFDVRGCDIDDICVASSMRFAQTDKIDADVLAETYGDSRFDLVTVLHVLEHCHNPFRILGELKEVTRAHVLLADPNARFVATEERTTHLFSWNRWTLANLIRQTGLTITFITEDWTNVYPRFLRLAPAVNRILLRIVTERNELIALASKPPETNEKRANRPLGI